MQYIIRGCTPSGSTVAEVAAPWSNNPLLKGAYAYSVALCGVLALALAAAVAFLVRARIRQLRALLKVGVVASHELNAVWDCIWTLANPTCIHLCLPLIIKTHVHVNYVTYLNPALARKRSSPKGDVQAYPTSCYVSTQSVRVFYDQ